MDRRTLIKRAGLAGILAAGAAPAVHAQTRVRWRLAASFPKSLDVMYGNPETFSRVLKAMSGGLFEVSIHAAGELMPAYSVVDGLQNGTVEMAFTGSHYFTGKDPAFTFGCTVPFGLTARQMTAWMEHGDGGKLLADFYAQYNIKNLCGGNTGTQMGGWYRKEMKTVDDFKGLKMRMGGGVFGEAMLKLGVVSQIVPIGEVYQSLEKGTLDAAEFVGPHDDQKLGLNKVAPYYYYPGWWEGGSELSYFINTRAWDALTPEFQAMLEAACAYAGRDMTAKYDAYNPIALKQLVAGKAQLRAFSKELIDAGFQAVQEVMAEHDAKSPTFKKIHDSMVQFQRDQILWERISEFRYNSYMATVKL